MPDQGRLGYPVIAIQNLFANSIVNISIICMSNGAIVQLFLDHQNSSTVEYIARTTELKYVGMYMILIDFYYHEAQWFIMWIVQKFYKTPYVL